MKFAQIFKRKQHQKSENSGSIKEFIAKLSRGLMLPIAMLPIAGLFLGIGSAITATAGTGDHINTLQKIFGDVISAGGNVIFQCLPVLFCIAIAITFTGDAGVAGLSSFVGWIVFCALQSAMIITHKDPASGDVISYSFLFWRNFSQTQYDAVFCSNVGIQSLSTGVFGGIVVGWCTAFLYNKFKNIQLPTILGFFSGVRFIPIITFLVMIVLSFLFSLVWPWIGLGFYEMGSALSSTPMGLNSLVFGFFNRALVPFGLHHVIDTALWFSNVGGTFNTANAAIISINGDAYWVLNDSAHTTWTALLGLTEDQIIDGDISIYIFLQELTGTAHNIQSVATGEIINNYTLNIDCIFQGTRWIVSDMSVDAASWEAIDNGWITCNPGQYTSGAYIFTLFALPSAAVAMLMAAPKGENRKVAASIVVSAAFVCFLTGITEPIEFTFLFLAPWLYWGFHALMAAVAYMIPTCMSLYMPTGMGCHASFSFSSGFLDYTIYGLIQDAKNSGANCWWILIYSAVYAVIYYFVFYYAIILFDIKTPGRGGQDKLFTKSDYIAAQNGQPSSEINQLSNAVIKAYGGKENIKNVDACITKLRVQVVDPKKVNKQELMNLGAKGVMYPSKQSVYAVFGTTADRIKNEMKDIFTGKAPVVTQLPTPAAKTTKVVTAKARKARKPLNICAPANGEVVSTKSVKDQTFSQDIMGKGFAIIPTDGKFVAPIAGKVVLVNNHAYAIKSKNGVEILVHIGIDTVKLTNKNVFKHLVKVGDEVKLGQLVVEANLDLIKKHKLDTITPVIVLQESLGNKKIKISKFGKVTAKAKILSVK